MAMALVSLVIVMLARTEKMFRGCNSYFKLDRKWRGALLGEKIGLGVEERTSMLAFTPVFFKGIESLRQEFFSLRQGLSICW